MIKPKKPIAFVCAAALLLSPTGGPAHWVHPRQILLTFPTTGPPAP